MVIQVLYSAAGRGGVSGFVSPETHYYSSYFVTSTWLWATRSGVRITAGGRHFSLLQQRPDRLWGHPVSYSMNTGVLFRR